MGCYIYIFLFGFSQDLYLEHGTLQFHASSFSTNVLQGTGKNTKNSSRTMKLNFNPTLTL